MQCPWCKTDADAAFYAEDESHRCTYAFWRHMTPWDTQKYIDRAAVIARVRELQQRAYEDLMEM
jgi:hypothetical protein